MRVSRYSRRIAIASIAAGSVIAVPASAADFKWQKSEHCTIAVSGVIADGDTAKLSALLKKRPTRKQRHEVHDGDMCLDVTGGSFAEASKIAKFMKDKRSIATVVPAGSVCLGACAIIFMAGNVDENPEEPGARLVRRQLHMDGQLVFHTLGSRFGAGTYTKEALEKAFAQGVAALAELVELESVDPGLLIELALLGPDATLSVDSVGKAREFRIQLLGLPKPTGSDEQKSVVLCRNEVARYNRRTGTSRPPPEAGTCKRDCVKREPFDERDQPQDKGTQYTIHLDEVASLGCRVRFGKLGVSIAALDGKDWRSLDDTDYAPFDMTIGRP